MKKKILTGLIVLTMTACLYGCGGDTSSNTNQNEETTTENNQQENISEADKENDEAGVVYEEIVVADSIIKLLEQNEFLEPEWLYITEDDISELDARYEGMEKLYEEQVGGKNYDSGVSYYNEEWNVNVGFWAPAHTNVLNLHINAIVYEDEGKTADGEMNYLRENQIANIDKDTLYSVISEDGVPAEMFENETISYEELATIMGCDGWLVKITEKAVVYWYCPEEDMVIIVPIDIDTGNVYYFKGVIETGREAGNVYYSITLEKNPYSKAR